MAESYHKVTRGVRGRLGDFHANQISMCLDPHLN